MEVLTHVWLDASVCPAMNVEMGLLGETLLAIGAITAISLSSCLAIHRTWCSLTFKACFGDRRHSRSEWLLYCIDLQVYLALDGFHQLIHFCFEVDLITRVESFVGGDSL